MRTGCLPRASAVTRPARPAAPHEDARKPPPMPPAARGWTVPHGDTNGRATQLPAQAQEGTLSTRLRGKTRRPPAPPAPPGRKGGSSGSHKTSRSSRVEHRLRVDLAEPQVPEHAALRTRRPSGVQDLVRRKDHALGDACREAVPIWSTAVSPMAMGRACHYAIMLRSIAGHCTCCLFVLALGGACRRTAMLHPPWAPSCVAPRPCPSSRSALCSTCESASRSGLSARESCRWSRSSGRPSAMMAASPHVPAAGSVPLSCSLWPWAEHVSEPSCSVPLQAASRSASPCLSSRSACCSDGEPASRAGCPAGRDTRRPWLSQQPSALTVASPRVPVIGSAPLPSGAAFLVSLVGRDSWQQTS